MVWTSCLPYQNHEVVKKPPAVNRTGGFLLCAKRVVILFLTTVSSFSLHSIILFLTTVTSFSLPENQGFTY
jgi:hypothetical protein